jgi:hypothetical protein
MQDDSSPLPCLQMRRLFTELTGSSDIILVRYLIIMELVQFFHQDRLRQKLLFLSLLVHKVVLVVTEYYTVLREILHSASGGEAAFWFKPKAKYIRYRTLSYLMYLRYQPKLRIRRAESLRHV